MPRRQSGSLLSRMSIPRVFSSLHNSIQNRNQNEQWDYSGRALIIYNRTFNTPLIPVRHERDTDVQTLQETLLSLNFDVELHIDQTVEEMGNVINRYGHLDHSRSNCCFLAILSHGAGGFIYGTDGVTNLFQLTASLRGCRADRPLLSRMPKFLIVETVWTPDRKPCFGERQRRDYSFSDEEECPGLFNCIWTIGHLPGYFAWRNAQLGSCFIQSLCRIWEDYASNHPGQGFEKMLSFVDDDLENNPCNHVNAVPDDPQPDQLRCTSGFSNDMIPRRKPPDPPSRSAEVDHVHSWASFSAADAYGERFGRWKHRCWNWIKRRVAKIVH